MSDPIKSLPGEHRQRLAVLQERIAALRLDAAIVTTLVNVRYLTGFTGSNGVVLLTRSRAVLLTDPRYTIQASEQAECEVRIVKGALSLQAAKILARWRSRKIGFEADRIAFADYTALSAHLAGVRFRSMAGVLDSLRAIKSQGEINTIREAVKVNSTALSQALARLKPLMTEIDLGAEIEFRMRRSGADGPSFETIVAAGRRAALPHARPTDQTIGDHHILLIDMGATVAGYSSDMTRTYSLGRPKPQLRRMYAAVLESQLAAIDAVKPGVTCGHVDRVARRVLRAHGLEGLFIHSLGHGLGLEIHEAPRIGRKVDTPLEAGMAITIEPGVYQRDFGGIRIEDTVVVTAQGCEVLTPTSKELTVL